MRPASQDAARGGGRRGAADHEERRAHADALYAGGRYAEAGEEYRALATDPAHRGAGKNALLVAAAACDLKPSA